MPSSFNGDDLFGPGPHRFTDGPAGEYVLVNARVDPYLAGSTPVGPLEQSVTVEGRLVAPTEEILLQHLDLIRSHLTHPPQTGPLSADENRLWELMSFVHFEPAGPVDRGRALSLPYTARFTRFSTST